ncbi:MAG TPA: DUF3344 domain-containing protein [Methanophagales archaeon]|nr:DUF3344 domain-containing protein [Methanophagales archaeon]
MIALKVKKDRQMKKKGIKRARRLATLFALSYLFLLLNLSMPVSALADNQSESVDESIEMPDLNITAITPYHLWSEKYDMPAGDSWFNLRNYAEVNVSNKGTADADERFEVILYADDEPIGSETEEGLPAGRFTHVNFFEWVLEGEDPLSWTDTAEGAICVYTDTSKVLKAVVDEEDEVLEANEANNEFTKEQKVVWNGYMADEPLENYVHGDVEGGIIYTTGDGEYRSYISGDSGTDDTYYDINYDLEILRNTKLARLYIYYTWAKPSYKAPKIGVTLTTPLDGSYNLDMEKSYNDIKGDFGADIYAWGAYAYDITEYVKESGSYVVSVKNLNYGGDDSDFAEEYSFAPPAILVVYEDTTMPKREYWINEGADLLMGGGEERPYGGFLSLVECKNSATFEEDIDLSEVEEAVLGVVSVWGGNPVSGWHSYLYFNDNELGKDLYDGYSGSCSEERGGISMSIRSNDAQVGLVLTDVTDDLERNDNMVIQGDDGDNMMPANAFLVITYKEEEEEEGEGEEGKVTPTFPNITACNPVESFVNNTEGEARTFRISVNQTVDVSWQINRSEIQTNETATEAVYTNVSAVLGTWNVSAIAINTMTGLSDMHTWIWHVALKPTPSPTLNITTAPSPTPYPISTSTPVPSVKPKPTPAQTSTPTEEKQKPGADKVPVPGFEFLISLFILIVVAYLIRRREVFK